MNVNFSENNQYWEDQHGFISVSVRVIGELCVKPLVQEIWNYITWYVKVIAATEKYKDKKSLGVGVHDNGKIYIEFYDEEGVETVVETDLRIGCEFSLYEGEKLIQ